MFKVMGQGQSSRGSRSKVKCVKPSLKVILADGLTPMSSCIFFSRCGKHLSGKCPWSVGPFRKSNPLIYFGCVTRKGPQWPESLSYQKKDVRVRPRPRLFRFFFVEKSVSYQKKDGRGHMRPSFFWYDNATHLTLFKNLGRLWLAYTEPQGDFYMLQLIHVDSRHFTQSYLSLGCSDLQEIKNIIFCIFSSD